MNESYQIARRKLGKTGEELSILGFGSIMLSDNPQEFANEQIAKAVDHDINYFDVAPSYGDAQDRLGPAIKPYRKSVFLTCKTGVRDAAGAKKEMEESLKKIKTDYFDMYLLHHLTTQKDIDEAFGSKGAMETLVKAKEEGKIRYIGFSAHSVDAAMQALDMFDFDCFLFPINYVCWHNGNFGEQVYKKAKKIGIPIVGLKAMAQTLLNEGEPRVFKNCWYRPVTNPHISNLSLRFALSKDITLAIPPGDSSKFWQAYEIVKSFRPLSPAEQDQLVALAKETKPVFSHV